MGVVIYPRLGDVLEEKRVPVPELRRRIKERFGPTVSAQSVCMAGMVQAYTEHNIIGGVSNRRPIFFVGTSLDDLSSFPTRVKSLVGYALHLAQLGDTSEKAKPLKGFGAGVLEVVPITIGRPTARSIPYA